MRNVMNKRKLALLVNLLAISSLLISMVPGPRLAFAADAWEVVSSPNDGTQDNYLWAVSARKFDAVVAVGSKLGGTAYNPIIEKWDGLNWKLKGNPSVAANAELFGVTT